MNKKLFLPILFITILLASCQNSEYKITGTIDNDKSDEFSSAYISERVGREMKTIETTKVVDGKFEFTGKAEEPKVVYLTVESRKGNNKVSSSFILENAKLKAVVDTSFTMSVTGSKDNDVLSKLHKEEARLEKAAEELEKAYRKTYGKKFSDEIQAEYSGKMESLFEEYKNLGLEYSTKHINTVAGAHIFANKYWDMTLEQKEAVINKMNDKTRSLENISKIITACEAEKVTAVGKTYTDFTMANAAGESVSLSDFVGETDYLLIDFWASWCRPCINVFPELKQFYEENKGDKFEILGVSLDKEETDWVNAINKYELTWAHMSDLNYWDSEGAKLYAINSIPATVLIDKNGVIVGRDLSFDEILDFLNQ